MISKFIYLLTESFRGIINNKFISFVVISNIAISLFFIGVFMTLFMNLNTLIENTEEKITFEVFLEDGSADIHILNNEIINTEGVVEATYISKEKAYEIFRNEIGEEILAAVEGNPLPASFKVKIDKRYRTPEKLKTIREHLIRVPFVEEVSGIKDWVPKLERIRNIFITISLGAIIVISLAMFFMIGTTIRVTFMARKELIKVMHLIGASKNSIMIPFIIEGFIKGVLGGLISFGFIIGLNTALQRFIPEISFTIYREISFIQLFLGISLGVIASFKSVNISNAK